MSEDRLDESYVGAVLEHVRGTGVPEDVTRTGKPGLGNIRAQAITQPVSPKGLAIIRQEQLSTIEAGRQLRSDIAQVMVDPRPRRCTERNQAIPPALPAANQHRGSIEAHVYHAQVRQLHAAQAR